MRTTIWSSSESLLAYIVVRFILLGMPDDVAWRKIADKIYADQWTRLTYSRDASNFQIHPSLVFIPEDVTDIINICQYAYEREIPLTPRGGGTGLLGQALTQGIVVDMSKHFNRIFEIGDSYVTLEPGVVKTVLDKELKKKGRFLPPDPSSSNFCTIGGMIANNSSGAHTLRYGSTIDYIEELDVVYCDGSMSTIGSSIQLDYRCGSILPLVLTKLGLIAASYPDTSKNSSGFRLDALVQSGSYFPQRIFAGAEGTLGIVAKTKLRTIEIPQFETLLVCEFLDLGNLLQSIPKILSFHPSAVELLGFGHLDSERIQYNETELTDFPTVYVEFCGESLTKLELQVDRCKSALQQRCISIEILSDTNSCHAAWDERRNSLNRILRIGDGNKKAIGIIEDTIVNPFLLEEFIPFVQGIYDRYRLDYVMYGHIGNGNIHTRPLIDAQTKQAELFTDQLAREVFSKVKELRGSISAEHGDGLARSRYIKGMFGADTYRLFVQVKEIFDKKNIMNPGKKCCSPTSAT
jgi:glycolate oxidase